MHCICCGYGPLPAYADYCLICGDKIKYVGGAELENLRQKAMLLQKQLMAIQSEVYKINIEIEKIHTREIINRAENTEENVEKKPKKEVVSKKPGEEKKQERKVVEKYKATVFEGKNIDEGVPNRTITGQMKIVDTEMNMMEEE